MTNHEIVMSLALRLYHAVEKNYISEVKDLVHRKGANCDIILPARGISTLHLAVGVDSESFSKEVTSFFLGYGGNPNVKSQEGLTPVHVASIWGRSENLKLLLSAGGDPHALDEDGYSPLYYAEKEGHFACIDLLSNYGTIHECRFIPTLEPHNIIGNGMERKQLKNLNGILLGNDFSKQAHSSRLSVDQVLQNILGNINVVRQSNDKQESKSWIASTSCFPNVEQPMCVDNSVFRVNLWNTEECVRNEQIVDEIERPKDETFSMSKTFTVSNSNPHLTFDNSDERVSSPETCYSSDISGTRVSVSGSCLSYGNFILSVAPSNRSTPISDKNSQILANHPEGILIESENYDGSKLTFDDSVGFEDMRHVTCKRKQLDQNSYDLSTSCPELHEMSTGKERKHVTHRNKRINKNHMDNNVVQSSQLGSEEYFTVPEEINEHTDEDEGVTLLEKRLQFPVLSGVLVQKVNNEDFSNGIVSRASSESSLPSCCTEELRNEIYKVVSCGCQCPLGPITTTTKRAYLRVVRKFKKTNNLVANKPILPRIVITPKFSRELEESLAKPSSLSHGKYFELEQKMMLLFDGSGKFSRWREGNQKSSFNYLLLDPRVTHNLPLRWAYDTSLNKSFYGSNSSQYWREFLSAIFYVGKGKRSRPYSHLYEAVNTWRNSDYNENKLSKKLKHILEIWKDNMGVICVHVFQNVIPAEAFTREAAMIDAIGLNNLKNEQRGRYYGVVSSLGFSEKRYFGSFLLHRALAIFMNEGERQIRPADID